MTLPGLYPEHDLFIQLMKLKNTLRHLKGEELMAGRAAVVSVYLNPGRVVLFGLRPQHRAQTHATFPMLFNALYLSARGDAAPAKPTN